MCTAAEEKFLCDLVASYEASVGRPFPVGLQQEQHLGSRLMGADIGLLAHDAADDPHFVFANAAAAAAFGYAPDEMIGMPSRYSAAPGADRDARAGLFSRLSRLGFVEGYSGRRVRKDGSTFWIEDATIWNVVDAPGRRIGQAALLPLRDVRTAGR
ncbi:PAS domain S-box-containing protein [Leifsonia shinshuensis]|nr:PAS domain S-box-containing protein [Leifsonia shinshuensis]